MLALPESWNLSNDLLEEVKSTISSTKLREPYYPGANDRHDAVKQTYGNCEQIDKNGSFSRLLVTDLDYRCANEFLFNN